MRAAEMPEELWLAVADWMSNPLLPYVCRRLWGILARQHMWLLTNDTDTKAKAERLCSAAPPDGPRALTLLGFDIQPLLAFPVLTMVRRSTRLRVLSLTFHQSSANPLDLLLGDLLAALGALTLLQSLELGLFSVGLTPAQAERLAVLQGLRSLECVRLDLRANNLGPSGAVALSALAHCPALRSLDAALTRVRDYGAQALAAFRTCQTLQVLQMRLSGGGIGPEGAAALAQLRDAPLLRRLVLNLSGNELGDSGAEALMGVACSTRLKDLTLHLESNGVRDAGATGLARLAVDPRLSHVALTLDLANNSIGTPGIAALRAAEGRIPGRLIARV